jgi:hypothetical protein
LVSRAWFAERTGAALTSRMNAGADDARNLALACARCNHHKGNGPDARGLGDPRAFELVETLVQRRLER